MDGRAFARGVKEGVLITSIVIAIMLGLVGFVTVLGILMELNLWLGIGFAFSAYVLGVSAGFISERRKEARVREEIAKRHPPRIIGSSPTGRLYTNVPKLQAIKPRPYSPTYLDPSSDGDLTGKA